MQTKLEFVSQRNRELQRSRACPAPTPPAPIAPAAPIAGERKRAVVTSSSSAQTDPLPASEGTHKRRRTDDAPAMVLVPAAPPTQPSRPPHPQRPREQHEVRRHSNRVRSVCGLPAYFAAQGPILTRVRRRTHRPTSTSFASFLLTRGARFYGC